MNSISVDKGERLKSMPIGMRGIITLIRTRKNKNIYRTSLIFFFPP